MVDETDWEVMAHRARVSFVVLNYCAHFLLIRNSLLSYLPSFDVVNETGRERMATGRYRAGGIAGDAAERGAGDGARAAPRQFCQR